MTLDPDLANELERLQRERGASFKQVLNEALREGLSQLTRPTPARRFSTRTVHVGRSLLGSLDDVGHVLEIAEGAGHA